MGPGRSAVACAKVSGRREGIRGNKPVNGTGEMGIVWTNLTAPCETYGFGACSAYIER